HNQLRTLLAPVFVDVQLVQYAYFAAIVFEYCRLLVEGNRVDQLLAAWQLQYKLAVFTGKNARTDHVETVMKQGFRKQLSPRPSRAQHFGKIQREAVAFELTVRKSQARKKFRRAAVAYLTFKRHTKC